MSKITPADAAYIITKAQYIALYTKRATELKCSGHQERADKEMALLETFVSGNCCCKGGGMTEQQQIIKEIEALLKRAESAGIKVSCTISHGEPLSVSADGVRWLAAATIRLEWEPKG